MAKKDEPNTSQDNSPEKDDELDSLSLDEKAAFEKIMAEIGQMNTGDSGSDSGNSEEDRHPSTSEPVSAPEQKAQGGFHSGNEQELSDDQQAALDKIMAEINAGENAESEQAESEPEPPAADPSAGGGDEDTLSDDQQAALDKIMAEINARGNTESEQAESEPEPPAADPSAGGGDEDTLSDDQQAALDKIMAEINARGNAESEQTEYSQESPPEADADTDGAQQEESSQPDERLTLDEFNDELTNLLSSAQQGNHNDDDGQALLSRKNKNHSKSVNQEESSAVEAESPPLRFGPAPQPSVSEAQPAPQASDIPPATHPEGPTGSDRQDYVILKEVDASQAGRPQSKKISGRTSLLKSKRLRLIKMASVAFLIAVLVGAGYWGRNLWPQVKFKITEKRDSPAMAVSSAFAVQPGPAVSQESNEARALTPNNLPKPVPAQPPATTFGTLKSDLASTRRKINGKINEIMKLKSHYQKGIQEEQNKIKAELKIRPARSLQAARTDNLIDLGMRAIQRRMQYIEKLDSPLKRLEASAEDLLFLERRTQLFETLNQWVSGPAIAEYKQVIAGRIADHLKVITDLTVDDVQVDPAPMTTIWSNILAEMDKTANTTADKIKNIEQDRQISLEICKGDYSRKYLLTELSTETAQCLNRWSGKDLYLNELTGLSPQAAKILAQWPGEWLSLNGLKEISPETAKHLSQWHGRRLSLNGLNKLSPQATAQLSQWKGEQLEMVGLSVIGRWENYATRLYLSEAMKRKLQMQ